MSKLPQWFRGKAYKEGNTVANRFSGKEYKLTVEELSMYDFIKGSEFMINMNHGHVQTAELIRDFNSFFKSLNFISSGS